MTVSTRPDFPAGNSGEYLWLDNVSKRYGAVNAVRGVSLEIHAGEFVALVGPSGCGKTTLLRLLAGLLSPDSGRILRGVTLLSGPGYAVRPEERGMGMVFQSYALWPHMTVFQNVAFGLGVRRVPREEARARVTTALGQVRLSGLEARYSWFERVLKGRLRPQARNTTLERVRFFRYGGACAPLEDAVATAGGNPRVSRRD